MGWQYWIGETPVAWDDPTEPLPRGVNLQKEEFVRQFVDAVDERSGIISQGYTYSGFESDIFFDGKTTLKGNIITPLLITPVDPGDSRVKLNNSKGGIIDYIDSQLLGLIASENKFSENDKGFVQIPPGDPDDEVDSVGGQSNDMNAWTLEQLNAEFSWAGFTRRTTVHPLDPSFAGWEYGAMQFGDIYGQWIWEDRRKILSKLKIGFFDGSFALTLNEKKSASSQVAWDAGSWVAGNNDLYATATSPDFESVRIKATIDQPNFDQAFSWLYGVPVIALGTFNNFGSAETIEGVIWSAETGTASGSTDFIGEQDYHDSTGGWSADFPQPLDVGFVFITGDYLYP